MGDETTGVRSRIERWLERQLTRLPKRRTSRIRDEREQIMAELVRKSRETGVEHLVAYHRETGRQYWITQNDRHGVSLPWEVIDEMASTDQWETWHNHPASFAAFSEGDVGVLGIRAIDTIWVVDNDGEWSRASLNKELKKLGDEDLANRIAVWQMTTQDLSCQLLDERIIGGELWALDYKMNEEEPRELNEDAMEQVKEFYHSAPACADLMGLINLETSSGDEERELGRVLHEGVREAIREVLEKQEGKNESERWEKAFDSILAMNPPLMPEEREWIREDMIERQRKKENSIYAVIERHDPETRQTQKQTAGERKERPKIGLRTTPPCTERREQQAAHADPTRTMKPLAPRTRKPTSAEIASQRDRAIEARPVAIKERER